MTAQPAIARPTPAVAPPPTVAARSSAAAPASSLPLVLLGRDGAGKPHASRFAPKDATAARQAAGVMGMATLPVEGDALAALAKALPEGKLFDSGRAFVPFVKGELYEKLHDHLPKADREALAQVLEERRTAAAQPAPSYGPPRTFTFPEDWSKIAVGNLVLAFDHQEEAWFEAYVVETRGEDEFVLRWRDWLDYPPFTRRRTRVALLHPTHFDNPGA